MNGRLMAGAAFVVCAIAIGVLTARSRRGLPAAFRGRLLRRMERVVASLPEGSPPRLIMSVLPRVREQNDQIIALLCEQNDLLRKLLPAPYLAPTIATRSPR